MAGRSFPARLTRAVEGLLTKAVGEGNLIGGGARSACEILMTQTLAFYGVGERARPYLDALARRRDIQIIAVCDHERRLAEQVAAGWHSQVFPTSEAMLREARPEALFVCVEPHLQGE